ncbi:MAG: hypothetical protein ABIH50_03875 [bacterium]
MRNSKLQTSKIQTNMNNKKINSKLLGIFDLAFLFCFVVGSMMFGFLPAGCARQVTQYVNYGSQMEVEITLAGTMEVNASRYFLVLAGVPTFKLPLPPPDNPNQDEMIEPGTTPRNGVEADYYTNYFSTWSGYCLAEPAGYFTVAGPFVQGVAATRESLGVITTLSNTVKFSFALEKIFGNNIPDKIYFDVVTVDWPTATARLPMDHINTTDAYISKVSGSNKSIDDESSPALPPALDIIKCSITIQ